MIAKIIVDYRSKQVDRAFDYLVPKELEGEITIGSRVIVPFSGANKPVEGFCVGLSEESEAENLKSVLMAADDITAFDEKMLETIEWMHERYLTSYIDLIHAVVPAGTAVKSEEWLVLGEPREERSETRKRIIGILTDNGGGIESGALYAMFENDVRAVVRAMVKNGSLKREYRRHRNVKDKTIRAVKLSVSVDEAENEAEKIAKRAPVQARMLDILCGGEFIAMADLIRFSGGSHSAVTALCKKGLAECFDKVISRDDPLPKLVKRGKSLTPTEEQAAAISEISAAVESGEYEGFVLHGVTGSGKTEVFMQAISRSVELGRGAIVLVPEISLTPQMVSRFLSRFGDRVAVFHSKLSQGERYEQWKRIKTGGADIVIGARSAVFAPLRDIGIIIVDEEHSETYKSEMTPRYQAKEVARFRAERCGAALVLASATPSIETYYAAERGEYKMLKMRNRYNLNKMPEIAIVDMRSELARGNRSMFSKLLRREIKKNLENGEQTILFLNRRGFSTFVSCRSCGYVAECPNCSISLTYHKYDNRLRCHYCGHTAPVYTTCPVCGSPYIRFFGGGTQRVDDEIKRVFPNATTIRMDVDTTGKKQSHEKILEKFEKEKIDILIGTQMVSKGLDFENVTLVGVVSADTMLHLHDFRSGEKTFDMLEQVSGRAGRGGKTGRAVIQTYSPENEAVSLVTTHAYEEFYRYELNERRLMRYPPFCDMIGVNFQSDSEEAVKNAANYFLSQMGDLPGTGQNIQILGPIPSMISKIKNKYRWRIIVKSDDDDGLNENLLQAEAACRSEKSLQSVAIVIDKSPNSIY